MDPRVVAPEPRHQLGDHRSIDGTGGCDDQLPVVALLDLAHRRPTGLDGLEGPLRMGHQRSTRQRQAHPPLGPLEDPGLHLFLQAR